MLTLIVRDHLNQPSKYALVNLEIGCVVGPCLTNDVDVYHQELILLLFHQYDKYLLVRLIKQPNGKVQHHGKITDECRRVQNQGNQRHLIHPCLLPFDEYYCRNQRLECLAHEKRAWLSLVSPWILWRVE